MRLSEDILLTIWGFLARSLLLLFITICVGWNIVYVIVLAWTWSMNWTWYFDMSTLKRFEAPLWNLIVLKVLLAGWHSALKCWVIDIEIRRVHRFRLLGQGWSEVREVLARAKWSRIVFGSWPWMRSWSLNLELLHIWSQYLIYLLVKPMLILDVVLP